MKIIIINGPNLNLLGTRETDIYGNQRFEDYFDTLKQKYSGMDLDYFQSNHEGALIDKLHEVGFSYDGIIVNLAGYTHTSVALADAIAAIKTPVVEVHISNIHAREAFRTHTYTGGKAKGIISGLGLKGYELAINYFLD
ncbi:MAG: type II 3-dehydroquinate dehydratase [Flammeovirgaceae bacterium]|nr:type II 3-dehydroquinate dehydratase [Flammeovirgaceae bacterium]MBE62124.1 type II 3-dehydroquinate dehydratase [Flammeovirgaceae bacterium]MBR09312.1 type II 3-dehydroquinate dehydratase [Rickettsiales bacterium]HCX24909.1 type II 3-dehydroquinate dehydratase [Cytophagales bacterium]|tara:strand:+ start:2429 stop:2845 length:417 start_codon:yes stop_codon:yes gene_type:complete